MWQPKQNEPKQDGGRGAIQDSKLAVGTPGLVPNIWKCASAEHNLRAYASQLEPLGCETNKVCTTENNNVGGKWPPISTDN